MQAVSLIQRSALLEQLSQVFKQTSYKVFAKFWIFTKNWQSFGITTFFTEFLHYKVLTKSTKFKNWNNKLHKVLETYSTLNSTKFLQSIEPLDIWTKLWTFIKLWTSFGILQGCYQVIEFERFYKAFTKVFDAYKFSTKFRNFSICVKTL